jgi:hypothetical protein
VVVVVVLVLLLSGVVRQMSVDIGNGDGMFVLHLGLVSFPFL